MRVCVCVQSTTCDVDHGRCLAPASANPMVKATSVAWSVKTPAHRTKTLLTSVMDRLRGAAIHEEQQEKATEMAKVQMKAQKKAEAQF